MKIAIRMVKKDWTCSSLLKIIPPKDDKIIYSKIVNYQTKYKLGKKNIMKDII